jgi:hypothetical protein
MLLKIKQPTQAVFQHHGADFERSTTKMEADGSTTQDSTLCFWGAANPDIFFRQKLVVSCEANNLTAYTSSLIISSLINCLKKQDKLDFYSKL